MQVIRTLPASFATLNSICSSSQVTPAQPACRATPLRKAWEPGPGVSQPDTIDRAALSATRAQQSLGTWMKKSTSSEVAERFGGSCP